MTFLSGHLGVDLYVVLVVHQLLDVLVHLHGDLRFWVFLVVERLNSPGGARLASFSVYK